MTPSGDRRATPDGAGDHRWVILAGMCLVTAVTEFDETVMAVALPRIDASFAAVLIPAGRLADSLGARRVFLAGAAVFAAGSAACALAPDVGWLIGARVVQGLGAATITPASFAIVVHAFRQGERGRALGLWAAAVAVGAAGRPLGGGLPVSPPRGRAVLCT